MSVAADVRKTDCGIIYLFQSNEIIPMQNQKKHFGLSLQPGWISLLKFVPQLLAIAVRSIYGVGWCVGLNRS